MSNLEALEARVDRLESHNKINELATAYAVACDEHDMDKFKFKLLQSCLISLGTYNNS